MVKTTIYKIVCKNTEIMDCYVGRSRDCSGRLRIHKEATVNEKNPGYNYKLYKTIRENGGFENWDFIEVETFEHESTDKTTPSQREAYYYNVFKATLNNNVPGRSHNESKKAWLEKNPEYMKKYMQTYIETHKEELSEKAKKYYEENKETLKAKSKKWVEENRDRNREYQRERCRRIALEKKQRELVVPF
jgi:hypothetical protein